MLKTLSAPPRPGSLRESALLQALMMQENIEHAKFRAMAQIVIDQKQGIEAFEEYMKMAFPYLETVKRRDKEEVLRVMMEEIKKGPLQATSQEGPRVLKSRVTRAKVSRTDARDRNLYGRMGRFNQ